MWLHALDGFDRGVTTTDPEHNVQAVTYDRASNPLRTTLTGPVSEQAGAAIRILADASQVFDEWNRVVRGTRAHFDS